MMSSNASRCVICGLETSDPSHVVVSRTKRLETPCVCHVCRNKVTEYDRLVQDIKIHKDCRSEVMRLRRENAELRKAAEGTEGIRSNLQETRAALKNFFESKKLLGKLLSRPIENSEEDNF